MKKTFWTPIVALALAGGFVVEAAAQVNPNQLIVWRKSATQLQAKTFFPIYSMTQPGATYDAASVQHNAEYLSVMTQQAWDSFQPTTAGGANTRAKDKIYKETAKFKERQDGLHASVRKLNAAIKAADQAGVGAATKNIARACNACHEDFTSYNFRFKVE